MPAYQGNQLKYKPTEQRAETKRWSVRMAEYWKTSEGATFLAGTLSIIGLVSSFFPLGGILAYLPLRILSRNFLYPERNLHDMPIRVPKYLGLPDGSIDATARGINPKTQPDKLLGQGVTYLGLDRQTGRQTYISNSDVRTHMTIIGTTGSGKTEFIFSLIDNQLIQNSGFIFVDAKGDINSQRTVCAMLRRYMREDDMLSISFGAFGRNFMEAQLDKPTNTMNIMASTSDGMLIELLAGMLDSGGGSSDLWVGRAVAYVGALTRPLVFLRDRGEINLSPSTYIEYMELSEIERLVFERNNDYPGFDEVLAPLRSYLITLPGYSMAKRAKGEAQDQKTNEQFGYITMQLTRAINDLSYTYGHIFGVEQGDVDVVDVILNRRCLTILLPALERSIDSLNMLGKLIIGSIKQMMAGSLGNKMEGLIRVTVDSRPTTANDAFQIILDEVGYMMVRGMSIIPAQARALNIGMVFASQSYTDLKRGSAEEAEAIWANTTIKVVGRLTESEDDETIRKVKGVAGQYEQMVTNSYDYQGTDVGYQYNPSQSVHREMRSQINMQDLGGQQDGEFHVVIGKKFNGGKSQGLAVVRILGFYMGKIAEGSHMYLNDLAPAPMPDKRKFLHLKEVTQQLQSVIEKQQLSHEINNNISQTASIQKTQTNRLRSERTPVGTDKNNIILFLRHAKQEIMAHADDYGSRALVTELTLNRLSESLQSVFNSEVVLPVNRLRNGSINPMQDDDVTGFVVSHAPDMLDSNLVTAMSANFAQTGYTFDRSSHEATLRHHYELAEQLRQDAELARLESVYADSDFLWESRKNQHFDSMYLNNHGALPSDASNTPEMQALSQQFEERQLLQPLAMTVLFNNHEINAAMSNPEQLPADVDPTWLLNANAIKDADQLRKKIQQYLALHHTQNEAIATEHQMLCFSNRLSASIATQNEALDNLGKNRPVPPSRFFEDMSDNNLQETFKRLRNNALVAQQQPKKDDSQ